MPTCTIANIIIINCLLMSYTIPSPLLPTQSTDNAPREILDEYSDSGCQGRATRSFLNSQSLLSEKHLAILANATEDNVQVSVFVLIVCYIS